jgi:PAS domain S-box-containing protein
MSNRTKQKEKTKADLFLEIENLRLSLAEAEETLRAIRSGEVDALVVTGPQGEQVFTLRGAESPYRIFFEEMNEGAVTLGEDGTIMYCNVRFAEMLNLPMEKIVGLSMSSFIFVGDLEKFEAVRGKSIKESCRAEFQLKRKKAGIFPALLSCRTLVIEDVPSVFVIVTDISERKQAEEALRKAHDELEIRVKERTAELEQANRELEAFAYSVSHDLRAPLRSLDGFSKILMEDYQKNIDSQGLDYLRRIRAASIRMDRLIDDLLTLSRIIRQEVQVAPVNLSNIVEDIAWKLKDREPARKAEFVIEKDIKVQGDYGLLRIAMENLLENAWKFSSLNKSVRIEFGDAKQDGSPVYYLRDDGAGFDMAHSDKLFHPFQRLHSEKEFPGTGIGLATVSRIIKRHGGNIRAESAKGKGTTFYFTLGK